MPLRSPNSRPISLRLSLIRYTQMAAGLLLLIFDQFIKIALYPNLCLRGSRAVTGFFNLVCVWNRGVSFGLGNAGAHTPEMQHYWLIALTGLLTVVVTYWWARSKNLAEQWGCILIISGAIGNIMDRLHNNAVFDFLDFHAFGYHWPAFNLADSLICVGVILLFIVNMLPQKQRKYF